MWFPTWANIGPNQGKVKLLALIDRQKSKHTPEVPLIQELLPKYEPFVVWWGYFGPLGLPAPIANRFAAESKRAMNLPDVLPKLDELGLNPIGSTPEELAVALRQDIDAIGKVVAAIGLKPE